MGATRRAFLGGTTAALAGCALGPAAHSADRRPRRVLLVAGPASHDYGSHEHLAGCRLLADRLNRLKDVEAEAHLGWPEDPATLQGVDALLIYADGGGANPVQQHADAVAALVDRGVGLGLLHYALIVDDPDLQRRLRDWIGACYELHWSVNPVWTATVAPRSAHPVTRGVEPFELEDEWYYHMRFREPPDGVTPLLSALPPASTLERPDGPHSGNPAVRRAVLEERRPQHLAWCRERPDGGRGLGFTGLHWHWNWAHDGFRTFLLNAACWLARAPIPEGGLPSARPTLDELERLVGAPPAGWEREAVRARIASFGQRGGGAR